MRRFAARPRGGRAGHPDRGRRQPALGRRRGDRLDDRAGAVRPVVDRGADQPRRHPRPRRDPAPAWRRGARWRADPGGHRRARRQPGDVQAVAAGRRDRLRAARRVPGRRASTRTSRSCCWRRSSACRCARTPAASGCASWCSTCRCSTTSRCPARSTDRVIEYVDHLHEHFVDPVVIERGAYRAPRAPGFSAQMHAGVASALRVPGRRGLAVSDAGATWR